MDDKVSVNIDGKKISVQRGIKLKDVLDIPMPCGGRGRCGKCKVFAEGELSEMSISEKNNLTVEEINCGVRLACMVTILGNCTVNRISDGRHNKILTDSNGKLNANEPIFAHYGAAIDIGTTTLAAKLFDTAGNVLSETSLMNPQSKWGADVISRIEASMKGESIPLAKAIRNAIDKMLSKLAEKAFVPIEEIDGIVITGNTAMLHFLTTEDVSPLSKAPFEAKRLFDETVFAKELEFTAVSPDTKVYFPPCISAFVGADTVCALVSSKTDSTDETKILVDIGTNGEMAIYQNGCLSVCSTAAGPAFEGAGISMGMSGKDGAIDHAEVINGEIKVHVIGNCEAEGICGSGLIDAVKCLLETEVLDETGYLDDDPAAISGKVVLTQEDIRMVQLAKSAIHAGINTMMTTEKISANNVTKLFIAGGFGSYLNIENAGKIGLLPTELIPKAEILGNAALNGAAMILLNKTDREKAIEYAKKAKVITLSSNPIFTEEYMEQMFFPV